MLRGLFSFDHHHTTTTTMTSRKKPAIGAGPDARLSVTVNGEKRELFMSFGLLNELCRGVGNVQSAVQIPVNSELRDYVLLAVLSERDEHGEIAEGKAINLRKLEISIEEAEALLGWVSDHVCDFFLRTMERVVTTQKNQKTRIDALAALGLPQQNSAPTQTGSES